LTTDAAWTWTAGEITARVAARDTSITEVIRSVLERAGEVNPVLNAVCTLIADRAMEAGARADGRLAAGHPVRPLEGVPFTVKDNVPVKGVRCTYGAELYAGLVADEDAVSVERFLRAGAILVGKTNTPEMADDPFCNTTNALFGQTRNPWDINRTPGGSTGGGAAATAAGIAPVAIGTDWGGSVRGPAAFCGIVGFRPSAGLVATYPDDARSGFAWDFAVEHCHAPLARSVPDVAVAASVLIGPDPRAPAALPAGVAGDLAAVARAVPDISGKRVALTTDLGGIAPVDPEVADRVRAAGEVFAGLGCRVVEASPAFSGLLDIIKGSHALGICLRYSGYSDAQLAQLSPRLQNAIRHAAPVELAAVARAERLRTQLFLAYQAFMADVDYLLSPTWGIFPFRIDEPLDYMIGGRAVPNYFDCILFTYALSVLGAPSVSVPAGLSHSGLPVGVQIAGARFADEQVLAAAAAYEGARGCLPGPPPVAGQELRPADPMFLDSPGVAAWA
jgi:amidase